jgi:hydroxyethylthiazole kinase
MQMPADHAVVPRAAANALAQLRRRAPRVHCITNTVAQNFTANFLLAAGVTPSMTISADEVGAFVDSADALLVNLGTFDAERRQAVEAAIASAVKGKPWVLDPVMINRAPTRAAVARDLVKNAPHIVRLNEAEFSTLAESEPRAQALKAFAKAHGFVVALSGNTDRGTDGARQAVIANGDALMARVTAMGCAVSALAAACLAVEREPWLAACAALLIAGIAGEVAEERAAGPGSFAVAIIDALHTLDEATLLARARVTA